MRTKSPHQTTIQIISALTLFFSLPLPVLAQDYIYEGDVVGLGWILTIIQNVLSIALRLVGIAALVMLVIGSIKLLTSSGDPKAAEAGKKTLSFAIGGLVVAALAWFAFDLIATITGVESIRTVDIPNLTP